MTRYRKKPVEIEARRYPLSVAEGSENLDEVFDILQWILNQDDSKAPSYRCGDQCCGYDKGIAIPTLEGTMLATPGDYIIKGLQGEFYPCKPDIFEASYERVEDA